MITSGKTISRTLLGLATVVAVFATLTSCDKLALEGPKKYKVDLMNILQDTMDAIKVDGEVPDKLVNELDSFMTKHEAEYGKKGSYVRSKEILDNLKLAQSDESQRFRTYQFVQAQIESVILTLQTEVPD